MMQIEAIVIYGKNGKRRVLPFNCGKNNIISGVSKTGKSTVGQIIEYCFGSRQCDISAGVVRKHSDWFGMLLRLDEEKCFVARKNPDLDAKTCNAMFFEISKDAVIPLKVDWNSNIDNENFAKLITIRLGIEENIHFTPSNQTRNDLVANIRHSLFYCFQCQYEIASPINLFHKESEDFVKQAIKDTIPYFFGAIDKEQIDIKQELQELRRKLLLLERKEKEKISIQGGKKRALQLLEEAVQVGLAESSLYNSNDDVAHLIDILKKIENTDIVPLENFSSGEDNLTHLQVSLELLRDRLNELKLKIDDVKRVLKASDDYKDARAEQKDRLESIGLFQKLTFAENTCPFCSQKTTEPFPAFEKLKKSLEDLSGKIDNLNTNTSSLRAYLNQLNEEKRNLKEEISKKKNEIEAIQNSIADAEKYKDLSVRRGKIIGRISLWLESYKEEPVGANDKDDLLRQIKEKEDLLSDETIRERMDSIFNIVSGYMTQWVNEIDLEYKDCIYRFSPYSATVFVDTIEEGAIPLKNLGSGSNWVGVHLLAYFAFQKYLIEKNRPVPSFILLDQPSQIYFPNQKDKTDWDAVKKIYAFIENRVKEMNGKLQIIVLDHADFPEDFDFKNATIERWDGKTNALIPYEWVDEDQ